MVQQQQGRRHAGLQMVSSRCQSLLLFLACACQYNCFLQARREQPQGYFWLHHLSHLINPRSSIFACVSSGAASQPVLASGASIWLPGFQIMRLKMTAYEMFTRIALFCGRAAKGSSSRVHPTHFYCDLTAAARHVFCPTALPMCCSVL